MSFSGFPPDAFAFYERLAADNSKAFWQANRDTYEDCVREPLEELVAELAPDFGAAKVFRPYRDVRFAKDKSPYKLGAAAVAREDGHGCAMRYIEVSASGLRTGGGMYEPDRGQLARTRRAIDDPKQGAAYERAVGRLADAGLTMLAGELKTAPRGFPQEHPRIEALRRKRHAALAQHPPASALSTRAALDRVRTDWAAMAPLLEWLEHNVGPADPREPVATTRAPAAPRSPRRARR